MNKYDYRALLRFQHTGSIAENASASSDVVSFGNDEAAQIHMIEIIPPTSGGNVENMFVRLIVDGNEYPNIYLHSLARKVILGDHKSVNPLENTCPKVGKNIQVVVYGGPGGVTGDFEVRVWGDYFKGDDAIRNFFGANMFNNVPVTVSDPFREKTISIHHPTKISISNVPSLPGGGASADKPYVMPMYLYNFNANATTPNQEYDLTASNVLNQQFPLFWDLDTNEAVVLQRIGASISANGKYAGIKVGNDFYPVNNFYVADPYNEVPLNPDTTTVESLNQITREVLMSGELGGVFVIDNGTAIAAKDALVGIKGKYIQL